MILFIAFLLIPLGVWAATVQSVFLTLTDIVNLVSPVLMSVAVAVFLYGIVKYILASGDTEGAKKAKGYIIYGIIGLFVMVAFWGLVTVLVNTFNLDSESSSLGLPSLPTLDGGGGGDVPPPLPVDPGPLPNGGGGSGDGGGGDLPPPLPAPLPSFN